MESIHENRRGFLKRLAVAAAGLAAVPALARPALAGRSRWRGGWGHGYGWGRRSRSRRRFYGGYPAFPGYYGGGFYRGGGYNGGGGVYYNRGFYGPPVPYVAPVRPNYFGPLMKLDKATPLDPLALLEC